MSFCTFADGAAMFDATPIENMFLIEHLYDAPAAALKVYLYARMLALHPELGDGLGDLARALRMDEDAVCTAFDYWERRGLARRVGDNPPAYVLLPLYGQGMDLMMDSAMYANRDFHNQLQALFGEDMISDRDFRRAADWVDILGFEKPAVVRLVAFGIRTSRVRSPKPASVFKRMDEKAERWSKLGIRTLAEVEQAIADEEGVLDIAREVLKQLGIPRQPSVPELESVRRWVRDWGCDQAQILEACRETTKSRNPSFAYLDSILQNRRDGGARLREPLVALLRELRPGSAQPSPEDEKRYQALLDEGFPEEMIQLAAVQCHQMNGRGFDDVAWRLNLWRSEGLQTAAQAEAYMKQLAVYSRGLRALYKRAGYPDRRPGPKQIKRYMGWLDAYPEDLIGFAAECSARAGGSMDYMESLLIRWQEAGVATLEAARAQHEAWRAANAARAGEAPVNPALNYQQRDYRAEDFGEDFFEDLTQYAKEGEAK